MRLEERLFGGFADVEVLPIENEFWRFYRLRPVGTPG
jgi:hypothetical protein